ncbi:MAG TPA: hypothetical protein VHM26_12420 [Chitinophagaceae bacterium]|nr:hypothetical protein [Chitinophagaceae bacterium]
MPKHSHSYGYTCYNIKASGQPGCWLRRNYINNNDKTGETGGDQPFDNRPQYYAVLYIRKL